MVVYYKYLFGRRDEITDSEGIVYSALVYKALEDSECFDEEGRMNPLQVRSFIEDSVNNRIVLPKINKSKLAESVGIKRVTIIRIMERLQAKHILSNGFIVCSVEMVEGGYMELPPVKDLSGQQKVFYALLKDRGRNHNDTVDTWARRLADIFHTTQGNVYYLLSVLEDKGYVERMEDGRLKIK